MRQVRQAFTRIFFVLMAVLLLPLSGYAKTAEEEDGPYKVRMDAEQISVTDRTIRLQDEDLKRTHVSKVIFGGKELAHPINYTVKQDSETGEVVITFKKAFLDRQEHGSYSVRVECYKHTAETTFQVGEKNSDQALSPPVTKKPLGIR